MLRFVLQGGRLQRSRESGNATALGKIVPGILDWGIIALAAAESFPSPLFPAASRLIHASFFSLFPASLQQNVPSGLRGSGLAINHLLGSAQILAACRWSSSASCARVSMYFILKALLQSQRQLAR